MSLSIVFSTKKINEDFVKLIKSTCGVHNVEILPYENPGKYSLNEVYNMGLEKATNDKVIFCHDDIIFNTKKWGKRLLQHFNESEFGVLGLAGTRKLPETGRWWDDINQPLSNMVGIVNHSNQGKTWESKYSRPFVKNIIPVVMLDGLFFAINRKKIVKNF